jgi:hypothetical protein
MLASPLRKLIQERFQSLQIRQRKNTRKCAAGKPTGERVLAAYSSQRAGAFLWGWHCTENFRSRANNKRVWSRCSFRVANDITIFLANVGGRT